MKKKRKKGNHDNDPRKEANKMKNRNTFTKETMMKMRRCKWKASLHAISINMDGMKKFIIFLELLHLFALE